MALSLNGSSQYLVGSTDAAFNFPDITFTVAGWMKTTTVAANQTIVAKGAAGTGANDKGWYVMLNNATTGAVRVQTKQGLGLGQSCTLRETAASNFNNGSWHHIVAIIQTSALVPSDNNVTLYADGVLSQGSLTQAGLYDGNSIDALSVGIRVAPTAPASPFTGDLAELAIWNAELTPAEIVALSKRVSPRFIRPRSRRFYAPLIRDFIDHHGMALTPTGIPTVGLHPPIYGL